MIDEYVFLSVLDNQMNWSQLCLTFSFKKKMSLWLVFFLFFSLTGHDKLLHKNPNVFVLDTHGVRHS
jgi:hypothetical protein